MSVWRIHWSLNDCGKEIIESETEEEAKKKFTEMTLTDLLGTNENFAHIMMIGKIKEG